MMAEYRSHDDISVGEHFKTGFRSSLANPLRLITVETAGVDRAYRQ
jgi:hypothetical protein